MSTSRAATRSTSSRTCGCTTTCVVPGFAEVRVRSTGERRGNVLPVRPPYNEEKDQGANDRYARARGLLPYRNFKDLVGLRALLVLLIDRHSVSDDQRDGDQAEYGG